MQIPPSEQLRFWAHELGGMAKTGLLHAHDTYERDRCLRMLAIAEAMATLTIDAEFTPDRPYLPDLGIPTPKVGCSVAAFDGQGRAVLIQRADNERWALPGGYAEIGSPPLANALREFAEETGFEAALERLAGVYDNKQFSSVSSYQFYICLFSGRIIGGAATTSHELQRTMLRDAARAPSAAVFQ